MRTAFKLLCSVAVAAGLVQTSQALPLSVSGSYGGLQWSARSTLTGVQSTGASGATAGSPLYHPTYPAYGGVVHLLMDYGPTIGAFICSGTLLADRRSILTAAHCVSDGAGTANPLTTSVFFQPPDGLAPGTRIQTGGVPATGVEVRTVSDYFVNSLYTGQVIDQNDIAVLRLGDLAPDWATSYGLYTNSDLTGRAFNVAGYGRLGDGATGANNFAARLRQGDNEYDFNLGNPLFGSNWSSILGAPMSRIEHSWLSDFDNGLAANDTACIVAQASNVAGAAGAVFCDLGRGLREVGVAGGDSGGPNFIDGYISAVNSYGLTFGGAWGDVDNFLNSSFGEFSGYVPVYLHRDFILGAMVRVPEPGTFALTALGLLGIGFASRRRAQRA